MQPRCRFLLSLFLSYFWSRIMKLALPTFLLLALGVCLSATPAHAIHILNPGDAIVGIDLDPPSSNSSYPGGENPSFAVDGTVAKYLNFGGTGSGVIVTPQIPGSGLSVAEGIRLTTANDAPGRDPTSYEVWGTTDAIVSADNSDGLGGENWTLISNGGVALPGDRETVGDLIPFANTDSYRHYKVIFPTNGGDGLFQIGEIELFGDIPEFSVSDTDLFNAGDATLAVQIGPDSAFPAAEGPAALLDSDPNTKYLNFGTENSGFIVTPASGPEAVKSFRITTANDFPQRDPSGWALFGTNDAVTSTDNSRGDGENWTLVDEGSVNLPEDRFTGGPFVVVDNDTAYSSYRFVVTSVKDLSGANSAQYAGIQFYTEPIPEPSSIALVGLAAAGGLALLRRK